MKYGDAVGQHSGAGIRQAYLTHNPDIGVAAVMDSSAFSNPYLGTRLKNFIIGRWYRDVGTSEWFSIVTQNACGLFAAMQKWDGRVLTLADLPNLQMTITQFFP